VAASAVAKSRQTPSVATVSSPGDVKADANRQRDAGNWRQTMNPLLHFARGLKAASRNQIEP